MFFNGSFTGGFARANLGLCWGADFEGDVGRGDAVFLEGGTDDFEKF